MNKNIVISNIRQVADTLSLLIDGATNYAIYMLDPDGLVAIWNRGAARIKGWEEAEIVGRSARLFYLPEDVAAGKPEDDLARARTLGRLEEESWRVRKDGSRFLANVTITALYGADGSLQGFGKVVRDITEQRAAQAALATSESRLAAILSTVPDAMVVLDAGFRVVWFSRTAEQLFRCSAVEMVGRRFDTLLVADGAGDRLDMPPLAVLGRQMIARRADGTTFPVEVALNHVRIRGETSGIAFLRDLTERERSARELRRMQDRLAHLDRVNLLGVIGSTLAHELNQPMSAIVNYAGAARDQYAAGAPAADVRESLDGVIAESLRAGAIVRRLRGFIARGELDKQPYDLATLIRESRAMFAGLLADPHVALRLDLAKENHLVLVERIQIQQVLVNLVRNAVQAMADVASRTLTIATRREGGMVRVSVCDTGRGIASPAVASLFEPFGSEKTEGMGVGLSICRMIVEAHGGRIVADSGDGTTCVRFTLPIFQASHGHE